MWLLYVIFINVKDRLQKVTVSELLGSPLYLASKQIKLHIVHEVLSLNGVLASVPDLWEEVTHKYPLSN